MGQNYPSESHFVHIGQDFQPYYTETDLAEPIDTDRIYKVLNEIHG